MFFTSRNGWNQTTLVAAGGSFKGASTAHEFSFEGEFILSIDLNISVLVFVL